MSLSIFINFDENCREAVTFYAKVFNLKKPHFITYEEGDTTFDPNVQMSEKGKKQIMSTSLNIAGTNVEFSDMPDNFEFVRGNSMMLTVTYTSPKEAKTIFDKLSEKGQIFVPFAKIPNKRYYGMVGDQFNISWIVKTQ